MATRSLSLVALALVACSAAPSPPPPAAVAPAPVSAPPPAKLGLVDDDPPRETSAEAPAVKTLPALPAFAARFEPVPLPRTTFAIVSVAARDDRDVWMLASGGPVLHWDGKRVTDRGTPKCFTDSCCGTLLDCASPAAHCSKTPPGGCHPFGPPCAMPVAWGNISISSGDVVVDAIVDTGGMRGSLVEAHLGPGGRWACKQGKDDMVQPGSRGRGDGPHAQELSAGGAAIRFEGPAVLVNVIGGYGLVVEGRRVPLPEDVGRSLGVGFAARGPGDLWLSEGGRVWRGNGLVWTPLGVGLASVYDVWFGDPGSAWILGATGSEGSEELVLWDVDRGTSRRFETPGATIVLHRDRPDFWLLGKTAFYFWDGRALLRAEAPLDVADAWRSPSGDLWVVGDDRKARLKGSDGTPSPAGAVFRLPAPGRPKP